MDAVTSWALIRTICAVIATIFTVGTFIGSVIYWKGWHKRSKELRKEVAEQVRKEMKNERKKSND